MGPTKRQGSTRKPKMPILWKGIRETTNSTDTHTPKTVKNRNSMANRNMPHRKQCKQYRTNMERFAKIHQRREPERTGTLYKPGNPKNKQASKTRKQERKTENREETEPDAHKQTGTGTDQKNPTSP